MIRRAMVLAAGRGTRLAPLTDRLPKPLAPVADRPLLFHVLELLRTGGIEDVVVNLHHLGHLIEEAVGDGSRFGLRVQYSREDPIRDTGGGIKQAEALLGREPFVVANGDSLLEVNLRELTDFHRARGGVVTAWADAWSALRADPLLRLSIAGTVVFWALAGVVSQDIVVYAKVVLRASDAAASLPLAALAVGIGAGSLLAGRLARGVTAAPLEYGLIPLGSVAIAALVLLLGALGPGLAGTLALMLPLGVASGLLAIPLNVLAQWRAPGHRRGAVIAFSNTFVFTGTMAGSLGAGALSQLGFSPTQILVAASAVGAIGAAAAVALLPGALRELVRRIARGLVREERA